MRLGNRIRGTHLKAAAVLTAVFLAGGGTGYLAGRWHALRRAEEPRPATPARLSGGPRARGAAFMHRLERDLDLRPDQRERVSAALRRHHEKMLGLRREMRPRVEGILQEAREELRSFLDPDQQRSFDRMVRAFHERRRRWRERMMRRHVGPPGMMMGPRAPRER